ncbi:hypothetical protein G9A89_000487, partial [Geosiphon pyriformis]
MVVLRVSPYKLNHFSLNGAFSEFIPAGTYAATILPSGVVGTSTCGTDTYGRYMVKKSVLPLVSWAETY